MAAFSSEAAFHYSVMKASIYRSDTITQACKYMYVPCRLNSCLQFIIIINLRRGRVTVIGYVCASSSKFSYSRELTKNTYGLPQRCKQFH